MTPRIALILGAAALPALFLVDDRPAFKAKAETTWTKTFTEKSTFVLDSMVQTIDGQEVAGMDIGMEGTTSREVVVVDECLAAEDGRATKTRRVFDSISGELEMSAETMGMAEDYELTLSSPLTEQPLRCDWNEDRGEYEFRFDDEDARGDSALLERLIEDTDLKLLLPQEEVEEGDSWTVDLEEGQALFAPGGFAPMQLDELPEGGFEMLEPSDVAIVAMVGLAECCREMKGELTASWKDTDIEGDHRIAEIELELEVELTGDLAEEYTRVLTDAGFPERDDMVFDCLAELEGEGTLLWDLDAGHFVSLELECETIFTLELGWMMDFGEIAVEVEVSGKSTLGAEREAE